MLCSAFVALTIVFSLLGAKTSSLLFNLLAPIAEIVVLLVHIINLQAAAYLPKSAEEMHAIIGLVFITNAAAGLALQTVAILLLIRGAKPKLFARAPTSC